MERKVDHTTWCSLKMLAEKRGVQGTIIESPQAHIVEAVESKEL